MEFVEYSNKVEMLRDMQATLNKLKQKHEALISQRDAYQEITEDFVEFLPSVRQILLARRRKVLEGVCGPIAELIDVPEQVENAIDSALGDRLQDIVVETVEHGIKAIRYLKPLGLGRATLISLHSSNGEAPRADEAIPTREMPGLIGKGIDLIEFDPKYRKVISSLMGDILVVRTFDDATRIATELHYRYRVLSLDGDAVVANGVIIGGSPPKKSATNLLRRKRRQKEINSQIANVEQQIDEISEKINSIK
ncbi:hypothetical protein PV433_10920 [Paenibacillus sp. GYB004]|uniref:hypothetical protein n=1 Tax=Paenibacillus sp. GYB004 TaxID=2994393 RepID=UPI002F9695E8